MIEECLQMVLDHGHGSQQVTCCVAELRQNDAMCGELVN
jgi:hypothetical protein